MAFEKIEDEDEAALRRQLGAPAEDAPPVSTTMPVVDPQNVAPVVTDPAPTARRGWNNLNLDAPAQRNVNQFHGYNDDRALAGTDEDSTKDALRRWLGGLDFNLKGQSKDAIDSYFESQRGGAGEYGLDIRDVQGDKILLNTKERGPEWIDFIEGAGGDNPAFAYQSDFDNTQTLLPAETGRTPVIPAPAGGAEGDSAMDQILKEVEALTQGATSPMDQQALEQLLLP